MSPFRAEFRLHRESPPAKGKIAPQDSIEAAAEWLLEAVRRELASLHVVEIEHASYREAVAILFTKATSTFMAIMELVQEGYGLESAILARSLMNLSIDLLYMAKVGDREENARRFFDYAWVYGHKDLIRARDLRRDGYVDDKWLASYERDAALVEAEFNRIRPQFLVKRKNQKEELARHWARDPGDEGIANRAQRLGPDEHGAYRMAYGRLSELEHSAITEAVKYKRVHGARRIVTFEAGPMPSESRRTLLTALRHFLPAFEIFGEAFGAITTPYLKTVQDLIVRADEADARGTK